MKVLLLLIATVIATVWAVIFHTFNPYCVQQWQFYSVDEKRLIAINFTANNISIKNTDYSAEEFLAQNPDCCELLPPYDSHYDAGWGYRYSPVVHAFDVRMYSNIHKQTYSMWVWVNKCGRVIDSRPVVVLNET